MTQTELVEAMARALIAALRNSCLKRDGTTYAHCDDGPAPDGGWWAEVEGEFNTYTLAKSILPFIDQAHRAGEVAMRERAARDVKEIALAHSMSMVALTPEQQRGADLYQRLAGQAAAAISALEGMGDAASQPKEPPHE